MAEIHSDEEFMAEIMALGQEVTQEYSIEELNSFMENAQAEIMDVIALADSCGFASEKMSGKSTLENTGGR